MSTYTSTQVVPLNFLNKGEAGRVVEIIAPEEWTHRLQELGLAEGALVRMVKAGEPAILAVDGHRFTFRCDPTTLVMVELADSAA